MGFNAFFGLLIFCHTLFDSTPVTVLHVLYVKWHLFIRFISQGYFPLQWAALNNRVAAASILLERGAEVNLADTQARKKNFVFFHFMVCFYLTHHLATRDPTGPNSAALGGRARSSANS